MSELHELRDALDDVLQGSVPDHLRTNGWRYQDFNTKFSPEAWDFLLRLIGDGEYQIICSSNKRNADGSLDWIRGQFWISPQGYLNMRDKARRDTMAWAVTEPTSPEPQR